MLSLALLPIFAPPPLRAKLVAAPSLSQPVPTKDSPSTKSGQTDEQVGPIDAERAFAADAKKLGRWTAFRKWAAPDAIFLPPQKVADALKNAKDPTRSVDWWPTASFLSCDGKIGANTGGAIWPGGRATYFSTIWAKQPGGQWRYQLDTGDDAPAARPRPASGGPAIRRASCRGRPRLLGAPIGVDAEVYRGLSPDNTLEWRWEVTNAGERTFEVRIWNGRTMELVISDHVAAKSGKSQ